MKLSLFPREAKFYAYLEEMADKAYESCVMISKMTKSSGAEMQKYADKISKLKDDMKATKNDFTSALVNSFITPYDREDLQALATLMYKVPKRINKIKNRVMEDSSHLHIKDFSEMADLILPQAESMKELIKQLNKRDMDKIHKETNVINDFEDKCDEVLVKKIVHLSSHHKDLREFMLTKDIYDMIEKVTDSYREAADLTLQIIMKHT